MKNSRFRNPRLWSNRELKRIADRFTGVAVNVSAWQDADKEGGTYRENYFSNISEYWLTNWRSDARGYQGDMQNEIYLDLECELPEELIGKFNVVFNHTTLEHIFDVNTAFSNLCQMSKDVVIVIVPFLQEQHGEYGDYWRFTPWALKRMFLANGLTPAYISANDDKTDAIYVFAVGVKSPESAAWLSALEGNLLPNVEQRFIGIKHFGSERILSGLVRKLRKAITGRG